MTDKFSLLGLPLTQEGAAKLNALVSRVQSRTTALQEMEGVKAGLVEALELNLRGGDLASGKRRRRIGRHETRRSDSKSESLGVAVEIRRRSRQSDNRAGKMAIVAKS